MNDSEKAEIVCEIQEIYQTFWGNNAEFVFLVVSEQLPKMELGFLDLVINL